MADQFAFECSYIGIVVLELGIFALYFTLNPRAERRRQELPSEATTESTAPQQQGAEETPDWSRHTTLEKPPQEHTT